MPLLLCCIAERERAVMPFDVKWRCLKGRYELKAKGCVGSHTPPPLLCAPLTLNSHHTRATRLGMLSIAGIRTIGLLAVKPVVRMGVAVVIGGGGGMRRGELAPPILPTFGRACPPELIICSVLCVQSSAALASSASPSPGLIAARAAGLGSMGGSKRGELRVAFAVMCVSWKTDHPSCPSGSHSVLCRHGLGVGRGLRAKAGGQRGGGLPGIEAALQGAGRERRQPL